MTSMSVKSRAISLAFALALASQFLAGNSSGQTLSRGSPPSPTLSFTREVVVAATGLLAGQVTKSRLKAATTFIQSRPDSLAKVLQLAASKPAEFTRGLSEGLEGDDSAFLAAALVMVSERGEKVLSSSFAPADKPQLIAQGQLSDEARSYLQTLVTARLQLTGSKPTVTIFGSGDIRGVATSEMMDDAAAGTGNLGMRVEISKWVTTAQATIASTVDTVREGFGTTMLNPGVGRALRSGLIDYRHFDLFLERFGIHAYASLANSNWALSDVLTAQAVTVGLGGLVFYNIARGKIGASDVSLNVEGGFSTRILSGDVTSSDTERETALGTERTFFPGVELGFQVSFGSITAAIQYYLFPAKEEDRVLGLTDGQITVAFNVFGEIVKGDLE